MTNAKSTGYYEDGETEDYRVLVDNFPLRVDLFSFNAKLNTQSQVMLDWSTTGEENFFGFEVQRSNDNINWEALQTVFAAGNGNPATNYYHSTDILPLKGKSFYRLKLISGDGKFRYSEVRMITLDKGFQSISVSPVPATDKASLIVRSFNDGNLSLLVTDVSGRIVYRQDYSIKKGENNIDLPFVQQAGNGMYFINTRMKEESETTKLMIIKQ
jgi:hypothetical protein